ncbi:NADH-quinone oxidoreductase subunit A [Candidatus Binatia bacterium]|nr:NADH-quinone oxidoreductase subunit A [Candidatus Binatia bacterium]
MSATFQAAAGESARMFDQYVPVLLSFAIAGLIAGGMLGLNWLLAPRRATPIKLEAFECGNPSTGSAWGRFPVKFYVTAILFIVFDVEVVLLYPWGVLFRQLGWFGFFEMLTFIGVLGLALLFVWRKGGLEWE